MVTLATRADRDAIEAEMPWADRQAAATIHALLGQARDRHGHRPALSFQLTSAPADRGKTLTWGQMHDRVTQAANLFRSLGVGPADAVAFVMPNALETAVALLGATVAGIVSPVNPMLDPEQMGAILRETRARVVVTLRAFPKTDLPQRVAAAVALAPDVTTVLEVDLAHYLPFPKRWVVPFVRPGNPVAHRARVMDFNRALARQPADRLTFNDPAEDRVAGYFHTGGTTGMPKVAQHRVSGMVYNGWLGSHLYFRPDDVILCPLPLFHVLAAYPMMMSLISAGAHAVLPTPAGYRGEGVFDNFWKLIAAWRATWIITVPTALSALMQRRLDADVSSLRGAFSGSAPLSVELFNRFARATGVQVIEGYGLTEATCLVSGNPLNGEKKIGSVGLPLPYSRVRILKLDAEGALLGECGTDEVGEICVRSPGVVEGGTYTDPARHKGLYVEGFLRTGDLGRIDADGYLFITGRAKDLIIRGGHNIDPAVIEDALMAHDAVAFVGAIGQPDAAAGELPCAYVELVKGAEIAPEALIEFARGRIPERAAVPKYVEILDELPKTAVGKVFKPDLRRRAIVRIYDTALAGAGLATRVVAVKEDKRRGLVARLSPAEGLGDAQVDAVLGPFTTPWEWAD